MNKVFSRVKFFLLVPIIFVFLLGAIPFVALAADEKDPKPEAAPATPEGQNVEKILYTLNETLKENRRVRQNMRDLQDSYEKLKAERDDLALRAQGGGYARTPNTAALKNELDASRQEPSQDAGGGLESAIKQQELAAKNQELVETNEKLKGLLNQSVLEPERSRILDVAKKNEESVKGSVNAVAGVNSENLNLKDQLVGTYFDLGNIYYDLGRYEDAIAQYKNALNLNPKLSWAYHNLAIIYDYHLANQEEARKYYQYYLNLKPPSEEARKIRIRLWDLNQLSRIGPDEPLKKDFEELQKEP
jgi:tetratricopeptide (TPR) repeat protein